MIERIFVTLVNLFFPPLAVMLVAGPGTDALINTLWFIAGIIPGHIHGFYITCTYFHRKSKVRHGYYPGGKKAMIYSSRVLNGDASNSRVRALWEEERREEREKEMRKRLKRDTGKSWGWSSGSASGKSDNGTTVNERDWETSAKSSSRGRRHGWWV